jgi:hypothetical protein
MKAILQRRIERLNREFALAKFEGRDTAPFRRRARSLSLAYHALES